MYQKKLIVHTVVRKKYNSYKGKISPEVPSVLQKDFHVSTPNQKWLTDLTEVALPAGKEYLSLVIDCFDGLVCSRTIGTRPNSQLVNSMLDKASGTLKLDEHPIIHSDRGSVIIDGQNGSIGQMLQVLPDLYLRRGVLRTTLPVRDSLAA